MDVRARILAACDEVMARRGRDRLSLSEVAATAGVSRPTLYRFFVSKPDLLREFAAYEQAKIMASFADAAAGLEGDEQLDAVLRAMIDFQRTNSLAKRVPLEPALVLAEMGQVMRNLRDFLLPFMGEGRELAASAVVRIAIGHYLVPGDDDAEFLAQLRLAAGLSP